MVTLAFAVLVLVFYNFPFVLPVTGGNMSKYKFPPSLLTITLEYAFVTDSHQIIHPM